MKKLAAVAMMTAIGFAVIGPAAVAGASQGAAAPFKATYVDAGWLANANCSGAHIVQTNPHNPFIKDSETCLLSGNTSHLTEGTIVGNPTYCTYGFGCNTIWNSDYNGAIAKSVTLTMNDNGDGTWTENVVAYY